MDSDRIVVVGIQPRADSIGPEGLHLRWMFSPHLGFPPKGFEIYRRVSEDWKFPCQDFSKVGRGQTFQSGTSLGKLTFYFDEGTTLEGTGQPWLDVVNPGSSPMLVQFAAPVVHVEIQFKGVVHPVTLRAYAGKRLAAESAELLAGANGLQRLKVSAPIITSVSFELNFKELHGVCSQTEAEACAEKWGDPVAKLPLLSKPTDAFKRLEAKLHNRYADDADAAKARYEPQLKELLTWQQLLQNPNSDKFSNPGAPPDQLRLRLAGDDAPLQELQPQSILLLAALDPNIARFLSLYWVDTYDSPSGPKPGKAYDYKVVGKWLDGIRCGLIFNLGVEKAPLPPVKKPVEADQLPGLRWRDREPLGRVGVRWNRFDPPPGPASAVRPVLFDLFRQNEKETGAPQLLTEKTPVLVPAAAWDQEDAALFVDVEVPLGTYQYSVRGIDLFGQVGEPVEGKFIKVVDLAAPPPPVRLRASLSQPGYPWRTPDQRKQSQDPARLQLSFEYGALQHQQAPDADHFLVYWRPDSIFERIPVEIKVEAAEQVGENQHVYTVRVMTNVPRPLTHFIHGSLTNVIPAADPLPADQRRRYRIEASQDQALLRLAPTTDNVQDGEYHLVSDPHVRDTWGEPLKIEVPVRQPPAGKTQKPIDDVKDFGVKVGAVLRQDTGENEPLAMLPAGRQPDQPPPGPSDLVEVLLNRPLLEPDVFTGGQVWIKDQPFDILYSTAGLAYDEDKSDKKIQTARIGLSLSAEVEPGPGQELILQGANQFEAEIKRIDRDGPQTHVVVGQHLTTPSVDYLARGMVTIGEQAVPIIQAVKVDEGVRLTIRPAEPIGDVVGDEATVVPPQVRHLPIEGVITPDKAHAPGGEMAFEVEGNDEATMYTARVVAPYEQRGDHFNLLVRFTGRVLAQPLANSIQLNQTVCRYYAPYQVQLVVDVSGQNGGPQSPVNEPPLWLSPESGTRPAYFAVSTRDVRKNEGPLSIPVQVTAVKPPPAGRPSAPFLCGHPDAGEGYASPPDRRGRATVCLAWEAGSLDATDGLRYEVARALDSTLIATDRRNWLLGAEVESPVEAGLALNGQVTSVAYEERSGTHRVEVSAVLDDDVEAIRFIGGRLAQNGSFFQITKATAGDAGGLSLRLRPMGQDTPSATSCTIQAPPDYAEVQGHVAALQQLAAKNEDAFGLVTGVPISTMQFTDEIPGIGRNRYFYRVRAVDAAENKSDWSEVSVPFYQVDTTPPQAPYLLNAIGGERMAKLYWRNEPNQDIAEYRIYRAKSQDAFEDLSLLQPKVLNMNLADGEIGTRLAPLVKMSGVVDLNIGVTIPEDINIGGTALPRFSGIYQLDENSETDESVNYLVENITVIESRRIRHVNPALTEDTEVVIVLREGSNSAFVLQRIEDNALRVVAGEIDLSSPYTISEVLGVYRASEVDYFADPLTNQSTQNFYTSNSQYNTATYAITQLDAGLAEGEPVVVLVTANRAGESQTFFMVRKPLSGQLLVVENSSVVLDLDLSASELLGIFKSEDYNYDLEPLQQTALDYLLSQPTEYDSEFRILKNVNPALADGAEVAVTFLDGDGSEQTLNAVPGVLYEYDKDLAGLPKSEFYYYQIVAVKRVKLGPHDEDEIEIPSTPSRLVKLNVFDSTPPTAPEWDNIEWIEVENKLAVSLRWQSSRNDLICRVQRRTVRTGGWLTVSPALSSSSNGTWEFIDNTAQPHVDYDYRIRVIDALGNVNVDYNIQTLSTIQESG
jgi:hypothetical protein